MKLFTEYPEQEERKYYALLAELAKQQMDKLYGQKQIAKRDTHAKTHACVRGDLEIFDFEPAKIKEELIDKTKLTAAQVKDIDLKQGLFAQPKQYPVWLRFANGRTTVENDFVADTRSMSVKIMDVEGERLSQSHELHTQDIITQNATIFFIKTIKDYHGFFSSVVESKQAALRWLLTHPRQFLALQKITKPTPKSLLTEKYWSGSAYALGLPDNFEAQQPGVQPVTYPLVIKYAFIPVSPQPPYPQLAVQSRPGIPKLPFVDRARALGLDPSKPDNYYREELIQALNQPDAIYCWDFGIQIQTSPKMSIDDVTIPWSETKSPFFPVGRLTVKHQVIDFAIQEDFGENLRFSPWNGLTVHRPVGALNRLRSVVYPIVAEYRHRKRGIKYQEPT